MKTRIIICLLFTVFFSLSAQKKYYQAEGDAFVGYNLNRFNNRTLLSNNTPMFILTGDKPMVMMGDTPYVLGTWLIGFERAGNGKWLFDFDTIKSIYTTAKMSWELSDAAFPGLKVKMSLVSVVNSLGMTASLEFSGSKESDRVIWSYGGAKEEEGIVNWKYDVLADESLLTRRFNPDFCQGNTMETTGNSFTLMLNGQKLITGTCSEKTTYAVSNPDAWENPLDLLRQKGKNDKQLITGTFDVPNHKPVYFTFFALKDLNPVVARQSPETCFNEGIKRTNALQNRIRINTPDKDLNALVTTSVAGLDAMWNPPVFSHGIMLWNKPYLAWRCVFGATMYGWHERVKECAAYYIGHQVKESKYTEPKASPERLYVDQAEDSRFFGKGYIDKNQYFYNMQSQFFDQIITEWRYTADKELQDVLYPALELHLEWVHECFDPDGDGLFESYRNTWPTDSHWYNGGGTAEETAYVYKAHLAAMDMCRLRGDHDRAEYHREKAAYIRKAFNEKLWIKETGHSAKVLEQIGLQRKHPDPWLYSIFLPADVGLIDKNRIMESLYYSEWALENLKDSEGGRMVYTSNFVPGIWSVRELWPGDNYHLALAYYKVNQEKDGWDLFRGSCMPSAFSSEVPANLGNPVGGTDFADCINPFARTLVEGIFGYNPDYPNGKVVFEPGFPQSWPYVSADFPDFSLDYKKTNTEIIFNFTLNKQAETEIRLPLNVKQVKSVTLNGKKTDWKTEPSFGKFLLVVKTDIVKDAKLEVTYTGNALFDDPMHVITNSGETFTVSFPDSKIVEVSDPQAVLSNIEINDNAIKAKAASVNKYHTLIVSLLKNGFPQLQSIRLRIENPELDKREKERFVESVLENARWDCVKMDGVMNGDIRTIYQQEYLSPRPNTVSLRIGSDGYSAWTFPYWDSKAPVVTLDSLSKIWKDEHLIETPQQVPFRWNELNRNVAFTSLWDNFPGRITVPVNRKGDAVWFLICGTTNPMQCHIANAVLKLNYTDGTSDKLELIPPMNYWNLSHIYADATEPGQDSRTYYFAKTDRFCMPEKLPETVVLGKDCRAMVLNHRMQGDKILGNVELETLSSEVIVGLMGVSVMNPK